MVQLVKCFDGLVGSLSDDLGTLQAYLREDALQHGSMLVQRVFNTPSIGFLCLLFPLSGERIEGFPASQQEVPVRTLSGLTELKLSL
ncbi:hypothetical protein SRB5_44010 [Streptomyces sp. RB5]|uniref:Uncharacterized protein n=1 Tax=Streptomyces smaragdinus TaxID=2585196 RepID=A0A7K0CL74_9ACTN|nr:hypothetical protein [Streptomyces smaragdinus]